MVSHASGDYGKAKVYYANCRLGGKVMLLTGPFLTAKEAEATLDLIGPRVLEENPECRHASFGVMECKAPGDGPGPYNEMLPAHMLGTLGIGVSLN